MVQVPPHGAYERRDMVSGVVTVTLPVDDIDAARHAERIGTIIPFLRSKQRDMRIKFTEYEDTAEAVS